MQTMDPLNLCISMFVSGSSLFLFGGGFRRKTRMFLVQHVLITWFCYEGFLLP
jgi:hypothetical protein